MGNQNAASKSLRDATERLEKRAGQIAVSSRYHRLPRVMEDDYVVRTKVLGNGYNGAVRMAVRRGDDGQAKKSDTRAVNNYAVKAFKLHHVPKHKLEELEAEVEIFLGMDHPHVARLVDVYESSDTLNLVMECMGGGELLGRVQTLKRFDERDAAEAMSQMLLAVNYIHSHNIVHRDIKLENFLYDSEESKHLKLIDFGFSKIWNPNIKMKDALGTLSYVAPEVLNQSYTSKADLWSLGVVLFILIAGQMPFSGDGDEKQKSIKAGKYKMKPDIWAKVSADAKDLVQKLLQVDPDNRPTAQEALNHPFIANRETATAPAEMDTATIDALRQFGQASKFKQACMGVMAWSLTNEERAEVRELFLALDVDKKGVISMGELKQVLVGKFSIPDAETRQIFEMLDTNHNEEVHYSDFLAAMVSSRIALHDDLIKDAFNRFDTDSSGYITADNLKEVVGETGGGADVEALMAEADFKHDGRISYAEFAAFLQGNDVNDAQSLAAVAVIDKALEQSGGMPHAKQVGRAELLARNSSAEKGRAGNTSEPKKKGGCCSVM